MGEALEASEAPEGPKAGPNLADPDSMDRVGTERRRQESVQRPDLALRRCWGRLGSPPDRLDRLFLARGCEDYVVFDEEEEEEASLGLEPREHLCWSREVESRCDCRWAHWSPCHAAAADEAAAAAAAAAVASCFGFGAKSEPVGGSVDREGDQEEEEMAV